MALHHNYTSVRMFNTMVLCRDMAGNQLHCDCEMAWMKKYGPLGSSKANILCTSPASLAGRSIESISYEELGCGKHAL